MQFTRTGRITPVRVSRPGMDPKKEELPSGAPDDKIRIDYSALELRILSQLEEHNLTRYAPDWVREAIKAHKSKA